MQTVNEDHVNGLRQDYNFWIRCKQIYECKCTSLSRFSDILTFLLEEKGKNKAHYHQQGRLESSREICINLSAACRGQFLGTKH